MCVPFEGTLDQQGDLAQSGWDAVSGTGTGRFDWIWCASHGTKTWHKSLAHTFMRGLLQLSCDDLRCHSPNAQAGRELLRADWVF